MTVCQDDDLFSVINAPCLWLVVFPSILAFAMALFLLAS